MPFISPLLSETMGNLWRQRSQCFYGESGVEYKEKEWDVGNRK